MKTKEIKSLPTVDQISEGPLRLKDRCISILEKNGFFQKYFRLIIRLPPLGKLVVWIFRQPIQKTQSTSDKSNSFFEKKMIPTVVKEVNETGLSLNFNLPSILLTRIQGYMAQEPCVLGFGDPKTLEYQFFPNEINLVREKWNRDIIISSYPRVLETCQAVKELSEDSVLREIAKLYFHAPPRSMDVFLWWNFVSSATTQERVLANQTVNFHFDERDVKLIYFSFYLTDTTTDSGPHIAILGSHKKKPFLWNLRPANTTDQAIYKFYGKHREKTITGPAGSGFVEDALLYHKAGINSKRPRAILQVRFYLMPGMGKYSL